MKGFFDYDGKVNEVLKKVMYVVSANLLFLLCSIPVVTIGAAASAMHTILFRFHQGDEPDILKTFFRAFKENFKEATISWMLMLVTAGTLIVNYRFIRGLHAAGTGIFQVAFNLVLLLWLVFWVYLFPAICYYKNTLSGYARFAVKLAIARLPYTVGMLMLHVLAVLVILFMAQYSSFGILALLCCGFSLPAYFSGRILLKMFMQCEEKQYDR